jgi:hypothetical protein
VWAIDDLGSALAPHAGHSVRASILEWRASIEMRSDVTCGGVAPIISTDTDAAVVAGAGTVFASLGLSWRASGARSAASPASMGRPARRRRPGDHQLRRQA